MQKTEKFIDKVKFQINCESIVNHLTSALTPRRFALCTSTTVYTDCEASPFVMYAWHNKIK